MALTAEMEAEVLSDEQIEQLLQEAEIRLRAREGQVVPVESEDLVALQETEASRTKRTAIPRLQHGLKTSSYISEKNGVAQVNPTLLATPAQQKIADNLRNVQVKQKNKKEEATDAGLDFFHMPKTVLTPQLKRDLSLLQMRSVLDPHRHYKKTSSKNKIPPFSQTGTVIEGPTEFFSSRINRKDRAKTFVDEAMGTERENGKFKRKYDEIQTKKMSGKKAHYKAVMKKRRRQNG